LRPASFLDAFDAVRAAFPHHRTLSQSILNLRAISSAEETAQLPKPDLRVRISNYGGVIISIDVPGRDGTVADIVQGFASLADYTSADYIRNNAHYGAIIGRFANRIRGATVTLDGKQYALDPDKNGDLDQGGSMAHFRQVFVATPHDGAEPSYSGNSVRPQVAIAKGYVPHGAISFQTQHYPDSPHHPNFPPTELAPGQTFHEVTAFRFSLADGRPR
jgi:galactose mutarotase-like enzyme